MTSTNLNEIVVFMAIAKAGSFVNGGRGLRLSGSVASKAITRLETRLGTRLLHRNPRSVSLTVEGQIFVQGGHRILAAVKETEASVTGSEGVPQGLFRLTVPDAFGRGSVLPLIQRFLDQWPEVRIDPEVDV